MTKDEKSTALYEAVIKLNSCQYDDSMQLVDLKHEVEITENEQDKHTVVSIRAVFKQNVNKAELAKE